MFAPEDFRKQMYRIEESTCDIVRTFRRPHSDSAPGDCAPHPPSLRPYEAPGKVVTARSLIA